MIESSQINKSENSDENSAENEGGEEDVDLDVEHIDLDAVDLDLVFFFVSPQSQEENGGKQSADWVWSKKLLKLRDLIEHYQKSELYSYINKEGKELFEDTNIERKDIFTIPKSWFIKTIESKDKKS